MSKDNVDAYIKQDVLILDNGESADVWTGSTDVSALTTSVNHREGASSLSFAKSGTTQTYGQISRTLPANKPKNLSDYEEGTIKLWVYLSSLTNVVSINVLLGESASHHYVYEILVASLVAGWNEIEFSLKSPSSTVGNGATWPSINYIAVKTNFSATGNTLAGILVDSIVVTSAASSSVLGSVSDAAITTDSSGTISGKLRGIVKMLNNVWDSVNGFFNVNDGAKSYLTDSIGSYDGPSTAVTSSVAQNASSVTLLAANSSRSSCVIYNESTSDLKIVYGATASSTTYTYIIPAQSGTTTFYFEMPKRYTGVIAGIWVGGGAGNARITELSY